MKTKIIQAIVIEGDTILLFTENPKEDIVEMIEMYEDDSEIAHLGCETPALYKYKFLGKEYDCINLWYDGQDDIAQEMEKKFNSLTK